MAGSAAPTSNKLAQSMWTKYMKSKKGNSILLGRVPTGQKSIIHQQILVLVIFFLT